MTALPVADAAGAPAASAPPAVPAYVAISAAELVRLAQGFYFIFWGLLVSVVVATHLVLTLELPVFAEMFLAGGIGAVVVGTWRLHRAPLTGIESMEAVLNWHRATRVILTVAAMIAYFWAPFFLWRRVPTNPYLLWNAAAFVFLSLLYMVLFSRAVSALARALGLVNMISDARLFSAQNMAALLLPLGATLAFALYEAATNHTNPAAELFALLSRVNRFMLVLLLLPFSLTLSLAWAAKDELLRALMERDRR